MEIRCEEDDTRENERIEIMYEEDDTIEDERIEIRYEEDDTMKLYEASVRGYVPTLNELIKKDPLVLNKISLMSISETLLHISASLGHLDFTKALLNYKPKLATELDSHKRSTLHLASVEGHTEIVEALLHVNNNVCLIVDEEGRIPLHYAAMRGRIKVIQLLISEQPESIREKAKKGKTVLHLCVLYNHLEALKLMVEYLNDDFEFLNSKDHDGGNTILHLAVIQKQVETTEYLLSRQGVEKNAKNGIGFTALDVIEHSSRDFKSLQIRNLLMKGVEIAKNQNDHDLEPKNWIQYLKKKCSKWIGRTSNWLEKSPKTLMLVSNLITTATVQSAINPPGGVWQETITDSTKESYCSPDNKCEAGMAVLAYSYPNDYYIFFACNTASFVASLCVIIVLVSGVPLENKFCLWLLTTAMTLTLIFMGIAYLYAMWLVTPDIILDEVRWFSNKSLNIMTLCLVIVTGFSALRFLIWLGIKLYKKLRDHSLLNYFSLKLRVISRRLRGNKALKKKRSRDLIRSYQLQFQISRTAYIQLQYLLPQLLKSLSGYIEDKFSLCYLLLRMLSEK